MSHKVDDAATATAMQDHSEHKPSHAALDAHDGREPSGDGYRGRHGASSGKHAGHHVANVPVPVLVEPAADGAGDADQPHAHGPVWLR